MAKYEIHVEPFEGDKGFAHRIVDGEGRKDHIVKFHREMIERFKDQYPNARVVCRPVEKAPA